MTLDIEKKYETQKIQFISKLAELLQFYEWDAKLLREAEAECGFVSHYSYVIFPAGITQIIDFYESSCDQLMIQMLNTVSPLSKVREKISQALKIRIKKCSSKIICKKNSNYFIKAQNIIEGTKIGWRTCDLIWQYAGDISTDYNHYSKRSLLLSVYLSAVRFYLRDESENYIETDNYIDQALEKIINIFSLKARIKLPSIEDIPILRLFS